MADEGVQQEVTPAEGADTTPADSGPESWVKEDGYLDVEKMPEAVQKALTDKYGTVSDFQTRLDTEKAATAEQDRQRRAATSERDQYAGAYNQYRTAYDQAIAEANQPASFDPEDEMANFDRLKQSDTDKTRRIQELEGQLATTNGQVAEINNRFDRMNLERDIDKARTDYAAAMKHDFGNDILKSAIADFSQLKGQGYTFRQILDLKMTRFNDAVDQAVQSDRGEQTKRLGDAAKYPATRGAGGPAPRKDIDPFKAAATVGSGSRLSTDERDQVDALFAQYAADEIANSP
tara:strand:- start:9895 stop:10767 length:873 start_codon:yes stop_codon:yes gene_type:complete